MIRLLTFLILLLPLVAFTPETTKPDFIVKVEAEKMTTDNLGNVYLIKGESISKYDSVGVLQKTFSNKNFGPITSADATNALRLILFYKDFNRVVVLDNTLSQNGEALTLETLGFPLTTLVAASHENGLWIYDQSNFELIRLNKNLQIENRSGNLSQILGIELQPNFLLEKDNRLFLNNPATGILIFDVFGTYSKTIPEKDLQKIQVADENVIFYRKPEMAQVNILTSEKTFFDGLDSDAVEIRFEKNAVFVLKENELDIFHKK